MTSSPARGLRPLAAVIGRWQTSGSIFDAHDAPIGTISGTDEYEWFPGGHWIVHRVDVLMGDDRTRALELIGSPSPDADVFTMRAFDESGAFDTMTLTRRPDGTLRGDGDGVRTTLWIGVGGTAMRARWDRRAPGGWWRWLEMHFARLPAGPAPTARTP
jgi:hypothetical protein